MKLQTSILVIIKTIQPNTYHKQINVVLFLWLTDYLYWTPTLLGDFEDSVVNLNLCILDLIWWSFWSVPFAPNSSLLFFIPLNLIFFSVLLCELIKMHPLVSIQVIASKPHLNMNKYIFGLLFSSTEKLFNDVISLYFAYRWYFGRKNYDGNKTAIEFWNYFLYVSTTTGMK